MDARDLFEIIGRLYAANVALTEENGRLGKKVGEIGEERDQLKKEREELKTRIKSLEWDLEDGKAAIAEQLHDKKVVAAEMIVDARREEDLLADMMGGDPVEAIEAMIPAKKRA